MIMILIICNEYDNINSINELMNDNEIIIVIVIIIINE